MKTSKMLDSLVQSIVCGIELDTIVAEKPYSHIRLSIRYAPRLGLEPRSWIVELVDTNKHSCSLNYSLISVVSGQMGYCPVGRAYMLRFHSGDASDDHYYVCIAHFMWDCTHRTWLLRRISDLVKLSSLAFLPLRQCQY